MLPIEYKKIPCPFCQALTIEVAYFPPSLEAHTSRTSAKSITKFHRVKERNEVLSGCSACGKTDSQVNNALKKHHTEPNIDDEKRKKRLEELKKAGFSGVFSSKIN